MMKSDSGKKPTAKAIKDYLKEDARNARLPVQTGRGDGYDAPLPEEFKTAEFYQAFAKSGEMLNIDGAALEWAFRNIPEEYIPMEAVLQYASMLNGKRCTKELLPKKFQTVKVFYTAFCWDKEFNLKKSVPKEMQPILLELAKRGVDPSTLSDDYDGSGLATDLSGDGSAD
jgi:hypothetical protein